MVHHMRLCPEPFGKIKTGQKTIELRLWDEKRQRITVGDSIVFTNMDDGEQLQATVTQLYRFADFTQLFQALPLLRCGYTAETVEAAKPLDMEQYYSVAEQKRYGVVGIELSAVMPVQEVTVCPMGPQHIAALAALEQQCFAEPWSAEGLAEELDNPHAVFLAAEAGGEPVGYVGMHHVGDEGFITNVAVFPAARRRGVARALLEALAAYGRQHALYRLTLEVRVSNAPAIALYEGLGWRRDGVRPRFYSHPTEDGAIYSYYFPTEESEQ